MPDFLLGLYGCLKERMASTRNQPDSVDSESAPSVNGIERDDHRNMETIVGVEDNISLEYHNE